jgi:hypothetical protein
MPYRKQIAEIEARIEEARAAIAEHRAGNGKPTTRKAINREAEAKLETLLGTLARLRAERIRLVNRQKLDWD